MRFDNRRSISAALLLEPAMVDLFNIPPVVGFLLRLDLLAIHHLLRAVVPAPTTTDDAGCGPTAPWDYIAVPALDRALDLALTRRWFSFAFYEGTLLGSLTHLCTVKYTTSRTTRTTSVRFVHTTTCLDRAFDLGLLQ